MDDIKGLTPHASRVNGTVPVATIPWRFTYLCWNIPIEAENRCTRSRARTSCAWRSEAPRVAGRSSENGRNSSLNAKG
jgi:hypothetical protein